MISRPNTNFIKICQKNKTRTNLPKPAHKNTNLCEHSIHPVQHVLNLSIILICMQVSYFSYINISIFPPTNKMWLIVCGSLHNRTQSSIIICKTPNTYNNV